MFWNKLHQEGATRAAAKGMLLALVLTGAAQFQPALADGPSAQPGTILHPQVSSALAVARTPFLTVSYLGTDAQGNATVLVANTGAGDAGAFMIVASGEGNHSAEQIPVFAMAAGQSVSYTVGGCGNPNVVVTIDPNNAVTPANPHKSVTFAGKCSIDGGGDSNNVGIPG